MSKKDRVHVTFDNAANNRTNNIKKGLANLNDRQYTVPKVNKSTYMKQDRKGRG